MVRRLNFWLCKWVVFVEVEFVDRNLTLGLFLQRLIWTATAIFLAQRYFYFIAIVLADPKFDQDWWNGTFARVKIGFFRNSVQPINQSINRPESLYIGHFLSNQSINQGTGCPVAPINHSISSDPPGSSWLGSVVAGWFVQSGLFPGKKPKYSTCGSSKVRWARHFFFDSRQFSMTINKSSMVKIFAVAVFLIWMISTFNKQQRKGENLCTPRPFLTGNSKHAAAGEIISENYPSQGKKVESERQNSLGLSTECLNLLFFTVQEKKRAKKERLSSSVSPGDFNEKFSKDSASQTDFSSADGNTLKFFYNSPPPHNFFTFFLSFLLNKFVHFSIKDFFLIIFFPCRIFWIDFLD